MKKYILLVLQKNKKRWLEYPPMTLEQVEHAKNRYIDLGYIIKIEEA